MLGFTVRNIEVAVDELVAAGITFERFAGMEQDARAVWTSPNGARVAWFADPDDNRVSLTQLPS